MDTLQSGVDVVLPTERLPDGPVGTGQGGVPGRDSGAHCTPDSVGVRAEASSNVIRPNATMMEKISLCKLGHLEDGNPVELGQQMGSLAKRYPHIDMWGGCCGTWEAHLAEIAKNVAVTRD